jgi:hypothetical protein
VRPPFPGDSKRAFTRCEAVNRHENVHAPQQVALGARFELRAQDRHRKHLALQDATGEAVIVVNRCAAPYEEDMIRAALQSIEAPLNFMVRPKEKPRVYMSGNHAEANDALASSA